MNGSNQQRLFDSAYLIRVICKTALNFLVLSSAKIWKSRNESTTRPGTAGPKQARTANPLWYPPLALFGSTARDTASAGSDVDILVAFDGPATSQRYFGVQFYLEDLLGCPVDLVTEKALRPELYFFVEKELVHV